MVRNLLSAVLMSLAAHAATPAFAQVSERNMARALEAADRAEIAELSARFDNSLDSEDAARFVATFATEGELVGFWGTAKGTEELRQAHTFMVSTFSKNKRHVVTNHEISINGDRASMYCYLTVFDRVGLAVTGTATFTDELIHTPEGWRFARRILKADPNVDPIIKQLGTTK
ncbi:nuclear transport factor 2 family protein [Rhizobium sp. BG4]|uniref:nuclear transport factor 2 family protein n=1 Tax=Rhizobium sp. BG4 TaxID=2613770 RepID=UPI00193D759E|nr:nuclear transport factor 2 family protein [Rhizobium sp. BG4]